MDSGYYAACAGLRAQTQALEVAAHNLANINTTGYREQQGLFRSLLAGANGQQLSPLNRAINDFGVLGGSRVDLSPGSLERTGNPFDLGIEGKGFFVVQTSRGTLYTRNGNFRVSAKGQLVTTEGDQVMGEQGPISVPSGPVAISPDGTLSLNGAIAGKLRLVEFSPWRLQLLRIGQRRQTSRRLLCPAGCSRELECQPGLGLCGSDRGAAPGGDDAARSHHIPH